MNDPSVADARRARLAAAAPLSLYEKARATSHLVGERRVVTSLFTDVVGSTSLAEQMDPEDWTVIMNEAFDRLTPAIYRYEGTLARLMGDALLAFFGAPIAHEDDPVRAVHAALDMIVAAHDYASELRERFGIDFAIRVGLNTGPVVVGEVGSSLVYEYTAMGDAVNLASRLQAAARPMTVLMAENTYRLISHAFECEDLGLIHVKGKTEPVHVYEVQQPKAIQLRRRGISGEESPLVGRGPELASLMELGQAVRAGVGRVVLVSGEPGIGKSRLVAEWKANITSEPGLLWVDSRCLSYGKGMAYHLLIDLIRSLAGIPISAGEEESYRLLEARCHELFPPSRAYDFEILPYLAHLLGLSIPEPLSEHLEQLDPQGLQVMYLASLRLLLNTIASHQPLVFALDDIQWADPSSVELLTRLLPQTLETQVLFCLITRPENDSPGAKLVNAARDLLGASFMQLTLQPLTPEESRQLVDHLLDVHALPESVRSLIFKKTEGNPFFMEEVIRMLIEREVLVRQGDRWQATKEIENIDIPDDVQSLLVARIDRLPDDVKHTLRVAAVIGRQFPAQVLEAVMEQEES